MSLGNGPDPSPNYARAALDQECSVLASTAEGRNDQLNRSAHSLGQLVGADMLEKGEVAQRLFEAAKANGYVAQDGPSATQATIKSGLERGIAQPRRAPPDRSEGRGSRPGPSTTKAIAPSKPAPQLTGVPVPAWTKPNDKGAPAFVGIGADQPGQQREEVRRHIYRRDEEAVRCKVKKASGAYVDWYRVRRLDTGEIGWQPRKPPGFVPVPYVGDVDPFDPEIIGDVLFWPEGEKDVDTLDRRGLFAFTFGGSSDVPDGFDVTLRGRDVVILADNDEPGRKCAERKAQKYVEVAARIRILAFEDLGEGADVSDFFAAGASNEVFWARVDAASTVPRAKPLIDATPFRWIDPTTISPRQWLYGWHYIRQFVSCTISPGGVGKSTLAIAEALAIATGRRLIGVMPNERANVWYVNLEDPEEELTRRVMAAIIYHDISRDEVEGQLFVDSGRAQPVIVAQQTRDGLVIATPVVEAVKQTIRDRNIGLVIIDPFVSCHSAPENDNVAINAVVTVWAHIADETGCAIELIHHARKTGGNEVTVEDGRGAVALLSKARCARALNAMTTQEAEKAGVENRRLHFRTFDGKANLAPPSEKSTWLRIASVDLGNSRDDRPSDSVGVATSWEWPDPLQSVHVTDLRSIQDTVSKGEYRADSRAADWVGKVVADQLRLDLDVKADRARIAEMLKLWTKNGMFKIVEKLDDKRRPRTFVEVDQCA